MKRLLRVLRSTPDLPAFSTQCLSGQAVNFFRFFLHLNWEIEFLLFLNILFHQGNQVLYQSDFDNMFINKRCINFKINHKFVNFVLLIRSLII